MSISSVFFCISFMFQIVNPNHHYFPKFGRRKFPKTISHNPYKIVHNDGIETFYTETGQMCVIAIQRIQHNNGSGEDIYIKTTSFGNFFFLRLCTLSGSLKSRITSLQLFYIVNPNWSNVAIWQQLGMWFPSIVNKYQTKWTLWDEYISWKELTFSDFFFLSRINSFYNNNNKSGLSEKSRPQSKRLKIHSFFVCLFVYI